MGMTSTATSGGRVCLIRWTPPLRRERGLNSVGASFRFRAPSRANSSALNAPLPSPAHAAVEGWILIVTGIHDEATDADVLDAFNEFGKVINCTLELDRRTGYVKGYSLVEFATRKEAEKAIDEMDGKELLGKAVRVDWAFVQGERSTARGGKRER